MSLPRRFRGSPTWPWGLLLCLSQAACLLVVNEAPGGEGGGATSSSTAPSGGAGPTSSSGTSSSSSSSTGGAGGAPSCDVSIEPASYHNRATLTQLVGTAPTPSTPGLDVFGMGIDGLVHAHASTDLPATATLSASTGDPQLAPHPGGGALLADGDVRLLSHEGVIGASSSLDGTYLWNDEATTANEAAEAAMGGSTLFLRMRAGGAIRRVSSPTQSFEFAQVGAVRLIGYGPSPGGVVFAEASGRVSHCPVLGCGSPAVADLGQLVQGSFAFHRLLYHPGSARFFAVAAVDGGPRRVFTGVLSGSANAGVAELDADALGDAIDLALVGDRLVAITSGGEAAVSCLDGSGYPVAFGTGYDVPGARLVAGLPSPVTVPVGQFAGSWPGFVVYAAPGNISIETLALVE